MLAAGSYDAEVWLWQIANPAKPVLVYRFTGATDWVMAVAFSPNGQMLAEGGSDGRVLLWNTATHALIGTFPHPQPVTSLAWDGRGMLISGDADGYVRDWRVPPPALLTGSAVNSVAFSPGGGTLAVGDDELQLWNPVTPTMTASATIAGTFVNAVAFSPAGNLGGPVPAWSRSARRKLPQSSRCPSIWWSSLRSGGTGTSWPAPATTAPCGCGTSPTRPNPGC